MYVQIVFRFYHFAGLVHLIRNRLDLLVELNFAHVGGIAVWVVEFFLLLVILLLKINELLNKLPPLDHTFVQALQDCDELLDLLEALERLVCCLQNLLPLL